MSEDPEKTEETTGKETGIEPMLEKWAGRGMAAFEFNQIVAEAFPEAEQVSRVTPTAEQLLDLVRRHELALALDHADPGFHLSNDDMRTIIWALSFAASAVGPEGEQLVESVTNELRRFDDTDKLTNPRLQQKWITADGREEWRDVPLVWEPRMCDDSRPPEGVVPGWPEKLPTDVIVACVGGGVTCEQVERIYSLVHAAMSIHSSGVDTDENRS